MILNLGYFSSAPNAIRLGVLVLSVGAAITDCELLSLYGAFTRYGPMGWAQPPVAATSLQRTLARLFSRVFAMIPLAVFFFLRLVSSVAIMWIVLFSKHVPTVTLAAYIILTLIIRMRPHLGNNGADKMLLLGATAYFLALIAKIPGNQMLALFALSSQLSLAYATAGIVKLCEKGWWNGRFLSVIFATETFGHRSIGELFSSVPWLTQVGGIAIVSFEMSCSFAPWLSPRASALLLMTAGIFHLCTAVFMGLNTFVFAYAAAFPAALYTSLTLHR